MGAVVSGIVHAAVIQAWKYTWKRRKNTYVYLAKDDENWFLSRNFFSFLLLLQTCRRGLLRDQPWQLFSGSLHYKAWKSTPPWQPLARSSKMKIKARNWICEDFFFVFFFPGHHKTSWDRTPLPYTHVRYCLFSLSLSLCLCLEI